MNQTLIGNIIAVISVLGGVIYNQAVTQTKSEDNLQVVIKRLDTLEQRFTGVEDKVQDLQIKSAENHEIIKQLERDGKHNVRTER